MNTTANVTVTAEDFKAAQEVMQAKYREDRRNSPYEGKVWFNKERDDYGRTIRVIKAQNDGLVTTLGVVVCVPRWTEELREKRGMERYFTNDWVKGAAIRAEGRFPDHDETLTQHKTLKSALAQFKCGTKEYELY